MTMDKNVSHIKDYFGMTKTRTQHPDQPLIKDGGVLRFKENKIVKYLVNDSDLHRLSEMSFDREDRVQLAQLIGYSLDGWADLPYITSEDYLRVANQPAVDIEITSEDVTWLAGTRGGVNQGEPEIYPTREQINEYEPKELKPRVEVYFVMAYDRFYPSGSFGDCQGVYSDLEAAIARANKLRSESSMIGRSYLFDLIEIWTVENNEPALVKRWTGGREDDLAATYHQTGIITKKTANDEPAGS